MKEFKRRVSIAREIFLLSIVPVIVVALASSWVGNYTTTKNIKKTATQLVQISTEKLASDVNNILLQYYERVKSLATAAITVTSPEVSTMSL